MRDRRESTRTAGVNREPAERERASARARSRSVLRGPRHLLIALLAQGCRPVDAVLDAGAVEPAADAGAAVSASAPVDAPPETDGAGAPVAPDTCANLVDAPPGAPRRPLLGTPALGTLGPLPPGAVTGVDASSPAPWRDVRDAGHRFAFAQAALGSGANASFAANWAAMKRCSLARGAYHFVTPKTDGAAQARVFVAQLAGDLGELPAFVDAERPPGCKDECCEQPCASWIGLVEAWIGEVERATGRRPGVYTVQPFWSRCLCGTTRFGARRLWLAGWPRFDFPARPGFGGFASWTFYQHAGNVRLGAGVVDLNIYRGNPADLAGLVAEITGAATPR